jgi:hypothetical protein
VSRVAEANLDVTFQACRSYAKKRPMDDQSAICPPFQLMMRIESALPQLVRGILRTPLSLGRSSQRVAVAKFNW